MKFSEQVPCTFEYALNWLVDHEIDLSVFDARDRNDEVGAAAYHPGVLLKVVLLGYARGLTSSRSIERACLENIVFMALSGDSAPHFTTIASFVLRADFDAIGKDDPLAGATVLTDSGYHSEATLQQLADAKVEALVADTGFRSRDPRFAEAYLHKPVEKRRAPGEQRSKWFQPNDFEYDPRARTCRCPNGSLLKLSTANAIIKGRRGVSFEGSQAICGNCPLRAQCIRKPEVSVYRQVTFFDGTKAKDLHPQTTAMKARKVDAQWKLFALVHNVQKLQGKAP